MIVVIINQHGVFALEREGQSPIATHIHRPMALPVAMERMQSPSRSIHILDGFGVVECEELPAQSFCMLWLNPSFRSFKEPLDAFVSEALYHLV